jgi:hypothetical protein
MSTIDGLLSPHQLTDLLNYLLRLPTRNGKTIIRNTIPVMVVKVWSKRHERNSAERWCDCELIRVGILEKPKAGPWWPEIPKCLQHWAGTMAQAASAGAR